MSNATEQQPSNRWAVWLLALTVTGIAAGLVSLGEVAVRYRDRHRTDVPGTMPFLFYRHARLRFALVRGTDYFGWVHVDSAGFRGPEVRIEPQRGAFRIMAVGSSTTFDGAVTNDTRAWPARLEYWLNQVRPDQRVEVINAGVPGYTIVDQLVRLEMELYRYRPDLIVLYEGHNDLFGALRAGAEGPAPFTDTPGEIPAVAPWTHWLGRHSLLYNKIVLKWQAIGSQQAGARSKVTSASTPERLRAAITRGAEQFDHDLSGFLALARNLGIRVAVLEIPNVSGPGATEEGNPVVRGMWQIAVPFAPPEIVLDGYIRFNQVIKEVAGRFSAPFVPTAPFGLVGSEWYADGDAIHFNDRGAERMACELSKALLASHLIAGRSPSGHGTPSSPPRRSGSSDR